MQDDGFVLENTMSKVKSLQEEEKEEMASFVP
jgi:hypothetical protein